jgi:hypothetical protein
MAVQLGLSIGHVHKIDLQRELREMRQHYDAELKRLR